MTSVIDLGCGNSGLLTAFPAALLTIVLFVLLASLGSLVGGGKRWVSADLISGWGLLAGGFTLGVVLWPGSLPACAVLTGLASLGAAAWNFYRHKNTPWPVWFLIALALQVVILALINAAGITGWDDIAQWSPNALFLWRHDGVPHSSLLDSYSNRPAYPYGIAYLGYLVSLLHQAFVVQAGAMINWLLLASFAWALTEFETPIQKSRTQTSAWVRKLTRFGVALVLTTLFNPGFNASFSITGQTDTTTSVLIGFLGLMLLRLHMALGKKDRPAAMALGWQIAAAGVVLVLLRDMNVILFALLMMASLVIALRAKNFKPALRALLPALVLSMAFFMVWRSYAQHMILQDKISPILPFAQWRWDLAPQLLQSAGKEILKKNGFYALMFGVSGFGLWAFLRGKMSKPGIFAALTGAVFIGYILFILTAFVGSIFFSEYNIKGAMSFYRYSTHVGLLGVAMLWFLFERYAEPRLTAKTMPAVAVFCLSLFPLVYTVKPMWLVPKSRDFLCADRALGKNIARTLPPKSRVAVFDTKGNGFGVFIMNLELAMDDLKTHNYSQIITSTDSIQTSTLPRMLAELRAHSEIKAVLLREPNDELMRFFNLKQKKPEILLLRKGKSWSPVDLKVATE
ncbi:MAG: hypothetical protein SFW62_06300 [Alphaproteobacteria bacterium]|nr:hypothetical protein [Alphaproteobacteria bacterium]